MDKDDLYLALIVLGVPVVAALAGLIFRALRRGSKYKGDGGNGGFDNGGDDGD